MGFLGLAVAAGAAVAQTTMPLHAAWDPPAVDAFLAESNDEDAPVDIASYFDSGTNDLFIYIAGTVTTGEGGKIFALRRYNGNDPEEDVLSPVFFPSNLLLETRNHEVAAMSIDPENGHVYLAGYTTKTNNTTDFRIVKYDKDLQILDSWGVDGAVDWDGGFGDDKAVDIVVHGSGTAKRVFVTGNSYGGSTHLTDIVTLALFPDDGDVDWSDRFQGSTPGVNIATEMTVTGFVIDNVSGFAPLVGGSSWEGLENRFDIVGIAYRPAPSSPQRLWVATFNGPASDHDFCTGVAALPTSAGTPQPVAFSGITPSNPVVANDWNYVTLALNSSTGDAWWSDGTAQIWAPPQSQQGSPDMTSDITLRTADPLEVWVTGAVDVDGRREVGTIAYTLVGSEPADLIHANTFQSASAGNGDNFGVAIRAPDGEGPVYVTSFAQTSSSLPVYLTLEYAVGTTLTVSQMAGYLGDELGNKATAMWYHDAPFVTGWSGLESGGQGWVTIRYNP